MKFSVALCTYNGSRYIREQLCSILNQSVPVDEIVICDDNSVDDTLQIARQLLESSGISHRIMVNDPPLGVANNFLKALKHTTGDYVFTCDQDDIWHEDKVQIFANAISQSHKALYFSNGVLVDGSRKLLGSTLWQAYDLDRELAAQGPILPILLRHSIVTGAAMLVSRQLIDAVDRIPDGWLHDEWFAVAAAVTDDIAPIYSQTFDYRQHGSNVVGAKRLSLAEKAKNWVALLGKLGSVRKICRKRMGDILPLAARTEYEDLVWEAAAFWEDLDGLADLGVWKGIGRVVRLYRAGGYSRFYTGFRGAARDFLSCFVRNESEQAT